MSTLPTSGAADLLQNRNARRVVNTHTPIVNVLTIAGSDSSGGAGIQVDLKTFAGLGVHGLSAITAITAQSMHQVSAIHRVPATHVVNQLQVIFDNFAVAAVKIGMLGSAAAITAVAHYLHAHCKAPIVIDPVLVSSSGTRLLPARALAVLREELIPLADMLTPNVPEAAALLGRPLMTMGDLRQAARDLLELGAGSILLKGGHQAGDPVCDYLADAKRTHVFRHSRIPVLARGTGCVLSSAIAAGLAQGRSPLAAVRTAEHQLQTALRTAYCPGKSPIRALSMLSKHQQFTAY